MLSGVSLRNLSTELGEADDLFHGLGGHQNLDASALDELCAQIVFKKKVEYRMLSASLSP
ncbi:hypothetical protein CpPA04_1016 [Corynebacterium pseudotuberculosis]|nr:hypothetical protein CpPA04_1016 [Corynebacterium pseudotuberculosis]ATQ65338.1 Hypothetical protein CpPA07_1034 [Corynebacterium pseudotuberculosis]